MSKEKRICGICGLILKPNHECKPKPEIIMKIFTGFQTRKIHESDKSLAMRALDFLMNQGITSKSDMYVVITKRFCVSKSTVSNARKILVDLYLEKYGILK